MDRVFRGLAWLLRGISQGPEARVKSQPEENLVPADAFLRCNILSKIVILQLFLLIYPKFLSVLHQLLVFRNIDQHQIWPLDGQ